MTKFKQNVPVVRCKTCGCAVHFCPKCKHSFEGWHSQMGFDRVDDRTLDIYGACNKPGCRCDGRAR